MNNWLRALPDEVISRIMDMLPSVYDSLRLRAAEFLNVPLHTPSAIRDPVPRKPNSTRSRFNRKVETQQAIRACTGQETDEAERCPTSLERSGGDDQEDGQGGLRDLGHELSSAPTRFQEEHM
jgi:hypothetical protein